MGTRLSIDQGTNSVSPGEIIPKQPLEKGGIGLFSTLTDYIKLLAALLIWRVPSVV
jgi:hypothetical protein